MEEIIMTLNWHVISSGHFYQDKSPGCQKWEVPIVHIISTFKVARPRTINLYLEVNAIKKLWHRVKMNKPRHP